MDNHTTDTVHSGLRPKVLIVFYSFSRQTRKLVLAIQGGLLASGSDVALERLIPVRQLKFPFSSLWQTIYMMVVTLFRKRIAIEELSPMAFDHYDLVVLAGPTWSFNPCGPVLAFLDRHCGDILQGREVLPVISCRRYWSLHGNYLKKRILKCGGKPLEAWSFNHPVSEPWNTIGLFMTLMGKNPKRVPLLKKFYTRYGHSNRQLREAERRAEKLGVELIEKVRNRHHKEQNMGTQ